jgi:hypothetical protein
MNDAIYFLIARIIDCFFWRGKLVGAENLPARGPAVFVANNLGADGPIGVVCSIPLRFYPWIVSEMLDKKLAPDYLRIDFIEPVLGFRSPWSLTLAKALSLISVPLLVSLGCISVNRRDYGDTQEALQESLTLLKEGKFLLVFPEEPRLAIDPETGMRPFLKGFTRLGELFYAETGVAIGFYPVAVKKSRQVILGKPVSFNPHHLPVLERHRLKDQLESRIKSMLQEPHD